MKPLKIRINDKLDEVGQQWWYKDRTGNTFTAKRDPINPRNYFYIVKNRIKYQIRCCDAAIIK